MPKKNLEIGKSDLQDMEKVEDLSNKPEKLSEKQILEKIRTAKKLNIRLSDFDEAVQLLLDKKKEGENVFIEFNGKILYSVEINDENDAYLQFHGKTKAQVEMEREKYRQEYEAKKKRAQLEAIEKIPSRIEEGKKYIDESKWLDWESYVNSSARDMYYGMDIDSTLELLKLIEDGESWKNVQKVFDDRGHSNFSYSIVRNRVVYFSKKGDDADKKLERM